MRKNIIHIYGASGSGTTTLARYIGKQLGFFVMDSDDYYWLPTDPPYSKKRPTEEILDLMTAQINKSDNVVISGSLVGWGDPLIPLFTLAVRLETDTDLRIKRIKEREAEHFGDRIKPGGDMYQNHLDFVKWAASYDDGDINMRSKINHDEWQKLIRCKQITLNGSDDVSVKFEKIKPYILLP